MWHSDHSPRRRHKSRRYKTRRPNCRVRKRSEMDVAVNASMRYEKKMKTKGFATTKLEHFDENGIKRTHILPSFNGDGSTEGDTEAFLYCLSSFIRFVPLLRILEEEKLNYFVLILTDSALAYYDDTIAPGLRTLTMPNALQAPTKG